MRPPRDRVRAADGQPRDLTDSELEVLRRIATGQSNGQIACAVGCSLETVKSHARRAYRKLGAVDRSNAVAIAIARGAIVLPPGACPRVARPSGVTR